MDLLGMWLKKIILLVLLATFVDLLLPNGSMQKYVRMVMGLLLLLTFLAPLFIMLNGYSSFDDAITELMSRNESQQVISKEEIISQGEKIKSSQLQLAIDNMKLEIAKKVQEDVGQEFPYTVQDVKIGIKSNGTEYVDLQLVHLELVLSEGTNRKDEKAGEEAESVVEPVRIDPVKEVMTNGNPAVEREAKRLEQVENWLQHEWSLKQGQVIVWLKEEGGGKAS